jgi:hypothetical protein
MAAKRALAAERATKAFELRKWGASFEEIGKQCGFSTVRAYQVIQEKMKELKDKLAEDVEIVRTGEIERLNALLLNLTPRVRAGDAYSISVAIKVLERKSRLLGLDAPTKAEVTGAGGGPYKIEVVYEDAAKAGQEIEAKDG